MIHVVVDDLAFVGTDAVVRPATAGLEPTTPSLRRLEQIGGPAFWDQLKTQQDLAVGAAVVTGAGELQAEFVIHAVIRSATEPVTASGVRRAVTSALQRARDWQITSLAVPPIGTGPGALDVERAARIMCEVLREHLTAEPYPRDVHIVVESEDDQAVFERFMESAPE